MENNNWSSSPPLEQRQSGRKARRAARATPTKEGTTSRGPSEEIERKIAERIEKRKASNVVAAVNEQAHMNAYGLGPPEILGTYEYLDHTADIQIHAMGKTFGEALEQLALAMFGYMTKLSLVEIDTDDSIAFGSQVRVQAHDLKSLVFQWLQEWLAIFHETRFLPRKITVASTDLNSFEVISSGQGETMKLDKHLQGTEVKAVTYSNLQVVQNEEDSSWDIWVILDI